MKHCTPAWAALLLVAIIVAPVWGNPSQYVDDFTSTAHRDGALSTAWWDTTAGRIALRPFQPQLIGGFDTAGAANQVVVDGNLAYVADGTNGLVILDITNPGTPVQLSVLPLGGTCYDIALAGRYAYLAAFDAGLIIVDVADSFAPYVAGSYLTADAARAVAVAGGVACVAQWSQGLALINVTNPAAPTLLGSYNTAGTARDVVLSGSLALVADYFAGLVIVDVSNAASPTLVGTLDTPGAAFGVGVAGDIALIGDGASGLQLIDITDPALPVAVGSVAIPGSVGAMTVDGALAYVTSQWTGVSVVDVADAANPVVTQTFDTAGLATGVALAGGNLFVADAAAGLQVVSIRSEASAVAGPVTDTGGFAARCTAVRGQYLYAADYGTELRVFDISDPEVPVAVGSYTTQGNVQDVFVSGDLAYLAESGNPSGGILEIVDLSAPTAPSLVTWLSLPAMARGVQVAGGRAYLADWTSGLVIADVSDRNNPYLLGNVVMADLATDLVVDGHLVYVAAGGLSIVDASDPLAPVQLGNYTEAGLDVLALSGQYVFMCPSATSGLRVIDVSDPTAPLPDGNYTGSLSGGREIRIAGDRAFVAGSIPDLLCLDISDPTVPVWAGQVDDGLDYGFSLTLRDDYAYLGRLSAVVPVRLYRRDLDTANNVAQSQAIDLGGVATAVRITSTEAGDVNWEVSTDGSAWSGIAVGTTSFLLLPSTGSTLRWRATLRTGFSATDPAPECSLLNIEWLHEWPVISAIADVPNDQGRQVRLQWHRSSRDAPAGTRVSEYAVFRRIDPISAASQPLAGQGPGSGAPAAAKRYPAGDWDFIMTVPRRYEDVYSVIVPTLVDSTVSGGLAWSTFFVSAYDPPLGIFYDSPPDSGYSVDNLVPGVPQGVAVAYGTGSGNTLTWLDSVDPDFQYFRIYRGTQPDFVPTETDLVGQTTGTVWQDPLHDTVGVYYRLAAVDFAGNESAPAAPGLVSEAPAPVSTRYHLYDNAPDPFNPRTVIRYDAPVGGGPLRIDVLDVTGRLVRRLLRLESTTGPGQVVWQGTDERGRAVASGVYFYRLEAAGRSETGKMVLVR